MMRPYLKLALVTASALGFPAATAAADPGSPQQRVTLEEARTLPIEVLAQRVLGPLASRVVQIERPFRYPHNFTITFLTRPSVREFVCTSDAISITFHERNPNAFDQIEASPRYDASRTTPCADRDPADFFRAPSPFAADYLRAAHTVWTRDLAAAASLPYPYECEGYSTNACERARRVVAGYALSRADQIVSFPCEMGGGGTHLPRSTHCYRLHFKEDRNAEFLESGGWELWVWGSGHGSQPEVQRLRIVYLRSPIH